MLLRVALLVAAFGSCAAGQTLKGEWGQAVLGCKCKGRKDTHGYCGYHFHWGSNEDQPWCRTQHKCGNTGLKGSWISCDAQGVERRRASDGKLYNVFDFRDFYIDAFGEQGWVTEWVNATAEQRKADDGKWYTWEQFKEHFGEAAVWSTWAAAAQSKGELGARAPPALTFRPWG